MLGFRLARNRINHGIHECIHARLTGKLIVPVEGHKHAAAPLIGAERRARNHLAPATMQSHQHAILHAELCSILRVQLRRRFIAVRGQACGFSGTRERMPMVAHASAVQHEGKIIIDVIYRSAWCDGDKLRLARCRKKTPIAEHALGSDCIRVRHRPLDGLQVFIGIYAGVAQAGDIKIARAVIFKPRQTCVLGKHFGHRRVAETVRITHALRYLGQCPPVGTGLAGLGKKLSLA